MRGIGLSISRLSTARAILAGAALLAGAAWRPAQGETARGSATPPEETAMVMPRLHAPAGASGIGLPQPLPPSEAARIRRIFALQRAGRVPAAVIETARLTDQTLLGHILADRYLAKASRATAADLARWLGRYADQPDACAIYALLLRKLPADAPKPAPPPSASLASAVPGADSGHGGAAARAALLRGNDSAALRIGRTAWEKSKGSDGASAYVAGLAAWRLRDAATAASLFGAASLAEGAGASQRAAAAYWAARAHLHDGDLAGWRNWLLRAAADPQTLHGMLARSLLGLHPQPSLPNPTLAEADLEAVAATPHGRRAFALLQVGEPARAEAELRLLWAQSQSDAALERAIALVADAAGLNHLVADLAEAAAGGAALLPVPALRPRGGFSLNPALVYAVAWVESRFETGASSAAGAHGLMQLTPVAAGAMGREAAAAYALRDPAQNLRLGQQYLTFLARPAFAGNDLLRVLASYNAGPSALLRWTAARTDDPLMFIETIPVEQTRRFVSSTLVAAWNFAARFGAPTPSLDALAAGGWPRFSEELALKTRPRVPRGVDLAASVCVRTERLSFACAF
jgi:soluble lytic murein transglycosylase-like protein